MGIDMSNYLYLIVIIHGMVESVQRFDRTNVDAAERAFISALMHYTRDLFPAYDIPACLEDGYAEIGQTSSVQLHWSDKGY